MAHRVHPAAAAAAARGADDGHHVAGEPPVGEPPQRAPTTPISGTATPGAPADFRQMEARLRDAVRVDTEAIRVATTAAATAAAATQLESIASQLRATFVQEQAKTIRRIDAQAREVQDLRQRQDKAAAAQDVMRSE
eukprot:1279181-Pyramimonas_sp.AAC.1